jgi:hypothetical protein
VLNADYKTFTKALTIKLAPIALKLIHPNQAGFLKGRRIDDHTELIKLMIRWCEAEDEDGLLVFLDQEKAYDKITHDFLNRTLQKFEIPDKFRNTIMGLYKNAHTSIIINSVQSKTFKITRGVRQGDPLSCLLFNLTIESLASMLRNSNLEGFKVNEEIERIITTLFADDTTVYLSKNDSFGELESLLLKWCSASGAKFNVDKTEVIPVGNPNFRTEICANRTIPNAQNEKIPDRIRIAKDGEPVRALGAFVGNKIDNVNVWTPTIETLENKVNYWLKSNPSLEGRSYLTKLEPGGRTQYRTMVQGMPNQIAKKINQIIHRIVWNDRLAGVNKERMTLPYEQGGKKTLDIEIRNKVIALMRLKTYLLDPPNRPAWAYVADELIYHDIPKSQKIENKDLATNTFLQTWTPRKQSNRSNLPLSLQNMINAANEYGLSFNPLITTKDIRRELPIWFHPGRTITKDTPNLGTKVRCLQQVHQTFTTGQLQDLIQNFPHDTIKLDDQGEDDETCHRPRCEQMRANECSDPFKCYETAKLVLNSLKTKWNPDRRSIDPDQLTIATNKVIDNLPKDVFDHIFNNDLSLYAKKENGYRLFSPSPAVWPDNQIKILLPSEITPQKIEYYLDATAVGTQSVNAKGSFGILTPTNHIISGRIPKDIPTNLINALILGTLKIVRDENLNTNITIHTNSTDLIEILTTRLKEMEDANWPTFKNKAPIRTLLANLRMRRGLTILREHNEKTDATKRNKAQEAAKAALNLTPLERSQILDLDYNMVTGMRLQSATQASLYRAILEYDRTKKPPPEKQATKTNLTDTRKAAKKYLGSNPTDETIWLALRSKHLNTKKLVAFLWRLANDSLTPNSIFTRNPALAGRAICPNCDTIEDQCRKNPKSHSNGHPPESVV